MNLIDDLDEAESNPMVTNVVNEIRQHEHKKRELIDPLSLQQYEEQGYKPRHEWQNLPPTTAQVEWLKKQGIRSDVCTRGLAHYIFEMSKSSNMATPAQERLLRSHGQFKEGMTKTEASQIIEKLLVRYKGK